MREKRIKPFGEIRALSRRVVALAKEATRRPWKTDIHHGCKTIKGNKLGTSKQAQYRTEVMSTPGLIDDDMDRANVQLVEALVNGAPEALADACYYIGVLVDALQPLAEMAAYYEKHGIDAGGIVTYYASSETKERRTLMVADAVRARSVLDMFELGNETKA